MSEKSENGASGSFDNFSGFDAVCTDHGFFNPTVAEDSDPLKIQIEASFGYIVGMTDIASGHRFFATDFA
jgi:hypothetical protein